MADNFNEMAMGAIPSPEDYRDIALAEVVEPITLPASAEVDIANLPVWHQRKIGACVGHATAKYKQKLDESDEKKVIPLSARFVYAICKTMDGFAGEGTYPRLSMKVLKDYGCATEATVPNDTTLPHDVYIYNRDINAIPQEAFKEAERYKISGYAAISPMGLEGIKRAIFQASGASVLMRIGSEWWSDVNGNTTWNKDQLLPLRRPTSIVSGHQIYFYKYEDALKNGAPDTKIYLLNSWSDGWADGGKAWFWWSDLKDFIVEAYTAVDIPKEMLEQIPSLPKPEAFKYEFKNVLTFGMTNAEVKILQRALQLDGVFPSTQPCTNYYGPITATAVLEFQKKYNVASLWEILLLRGRRVGPKTLAKLNELFNK